MYTDPSGEWLWIPMVIGAYFGGKAANDGEWNLFKWDFDGETLLGVGIGGALGYFTGYAGAKAGLNLATTMGAPGFGMTSGMVSGAVYSGISSDWNPAAMFMGAWSGGMAGGVSGLAMSGLGAAWDGISFGHTGTIGDAVRKGLGGLPGLTYRDWSMSQVIWTGFNLPSAGTMLANTSMLVNGALHGQWGSKLVPVGRTRNEKIDYPVLFKKWHETNGKSSIRGYWNIRRQNFYDADLGRNSKVMSVSRVKGYYYPADISMRLSLNGASTGYVTKDGSTPWYDIPWEYNYILQTKTGFNGNWTSPSVILRHYGKVYRRYGSAFGQIESPWWRRLFFGM